MRPPTIDTTLPPEQELGVIMMREVVDEMSHEECKKWLMKYIYMNKLLTHITKQMSNALKLRSQH